MTLAVLRDQVRDLLSETEENLPTATLNTLIERATQRIESDYSDDYGPKPRQMIHKVGVTITATGAPLPADFLRPRAVRIGQYNFRYNTLENMATESAHVDATAEITYLKKLDKLVNDADTNWLLDLASRVYVYATAIEYAEWNKEPQGTKDRYSQEYLDAARTTARANSPRPAGGFGRQTDWVGGFYSINGNNMIFGTK